MVLLVRIGLLAGADLDHLGSIPAVAGDEGRVVDYIQKRLEGQGAIDRTGSLSVTFGDGEPRTLIAAGLDEPGYVVSSITSDGYLQLQSLAEPPPNYQFDQHWFGRSVWISRFQQPLLPAVIAAPSVHFSSERGYAAGARRIDRLFVDLGAESSEDVRAAGVGSLDRISLQREATRFPDGRVAGAWISSRAGAAVLLALADRMRQTPPASSVTLLFAAQQHYHNAGLLHALARGRHTRAITLRPGGGEQPAVASVTGSSSLLADKLLERAQSLGLRVGRGSREKISFGPFTRKGPWPEQASALTLGVQHADTPIETVSVTALAEVVRLLGDLCGLPPGIDWEAALETDREPPKMDVVPQPEPSDRIEATLATLVALPGVSGDEERVREAIVKLVPDWAAERAEQDEKGNLIIRVGSAVSPPRALFVAHMDEIGYRAKRTHSTGLVSLEPQGGIDAELFAWRPMLLWDRWQPFPALMLRAGTADLGEREFGNAVLTSRGKRLQRLLGQRVTARSLDDRVGCATLIETLWRSRPDESAAPVWFVFSVEEEIGLLGAEALAATVRPERVYAVDSLVTSDSPLEPKRFANLRLGAGAALRAMDSSGITPRAEAERVKALARDKGIAVQVGVTAGGNDGSKFVAAGAVNIPLSFPLRYSHSAVETADLRDIRSLADLVEALAKDESRR